MTNHAFNGLGHDEAERLAILAEECAEVIQVVGKILRHGYKSSNPYDSSSNTNRDYLERELGDLQAILSIMSTANDIKTQTITEYSEVKLKHIGLYLHHNALVKHEEL